MQSLQYIYLRSSVNMLPWVVYIGYGLLYVLYSMVSVQKINLLLANTFQNDTTLTKSLYDIDRTTSECLSWQGHLPFYLLLIICNFVMNAIMNFITLYVCQIAFVQYFTFWTFVSLNFCCTHSQFCMHTGDKHAHHPTYDLSIWIFSELRSKAYVERCRACRPED